MSNFGFILLKIISFATWFQRSKRYLYCARNVGQISHYAEQFLTVTMVMMQYKHKCKKGAVESKLHVCKSHPLLPAGQKALIFTIWCLFFYFSSFSGSGCDWMIKVCFGGVTWNSKDFHISDFSFVCLCVPKICLRQLPLIMQLKGINLMIV